MSFCLIAKLFLHMTLNKFIEDVLRVKTLCLLCLTLTLSWFVQSDSFMVA